jgi:hypothetical protein
MTYDESARPDDQMGADEQVAQPDEELQEAAEPAGGLPDGIELDEPDVSGPVP